MSDVRQGVRRSGRRAEVLWTMIGFLFVVALWALAVWGVSNMERD